MNSQQQRDADRAIKELDQALDALGAAHQVVEISEVQAGDIYNGEEQTTNSLVVRFYPRFDAPEIYRAIADALTTTTL